jgi:nucleoid DNA-binding protein
MTLTKADIARAVSQKTNLGQTRFSQLVDNLFEIIRERLEALQSLVQKAQRTNRFYRNLGQ